MRPSYLKVIFITLTAFSYAFFFYGCTSKDSKNVDNKLYGNKFNDYVLTRDVEKLPINFMGLDVEEFYKYFEMKIVKGEYEKKDEYIKRIQSIIPDNIIVINAESAYISYNADKELIKITLPSKVLSVSNGDLNNAIFGKQEEIDMGSDGTTYKYYGVMVIKYINLNSRFRTLYDYSFSLSIDKAKRIKNNLKVLFVVRPLIYVDSFIIFRTWNIENDYPRQYHKYYCFIGKDLQIWTYNTSNGEIVNKHTYEF